MKIKQITPQSTSVPEPSLVVSSSPDEVTNSFEVKPTRKIPPFWVVGSIILLGVLIGTVILSRSKQSLIGSLYNPGGVSSQSWVNCDDIREVLPSGNDLYLACLGGVLAVNKDSGVITDQIGMPDGLTNATATSLVKRGDELYIGTQDGVTIFNVKDRQAKKIRVEEGLINGANMILALDGDYVWIGTFDGIARLDTRTKTLRNYKREIGNFEKINVSSVIVTPKSVYATILFNGVARFDKESETWTMYGPDQFGQSGQYARTDFNYAVYSDNQIYVTDSGTLWHRSDDADSKWVDGGDIIKQIRNDLGDQYNAYPKIRVGNDNELYFVVEEKKVYRYDITQGKLETLYEFENQDYIYSLIKSSDGKIWSRDKNFISYFDPGSKKFISVPFTNSRPLAFLQLLLLIDNRPLFMANDSIWMAKGTDAFEKFMSKDDFDFKIDLSGALMFPLVGTKDIFLFSQSCGQGCGKPYLALVDYSSKNPKEIEIPKEIGEDQNNSLVPKDLTSYKQLTFKAIDATGNKVFFSTSYDNTSFAVYDMSKGSWEVINEMPKDIDGYGYTHCIGNFTFDKNKRFEINECGEKSENSDYIWEARGESKNDLYQINKATKEERKLDLILAPFEYSPFGSKSYWSLRSPGEFVGNKLWIKTDRGLVIYDPKTGKQELIDTTKGLVSNNVGSLLVGSDYFWVITGWGGLSRIGITK